MTDAAGMPCPVCKVALVMSERQGVEIDYCPQCRGVWLDRGELDKIIERSSEDVQSAAPVFTTTQAEPYRQGYDQQRSHDQHRGYPKRRKSFLQELFD